MARPIRWCVTGASGQLGSVLVRQLCVAGEDVVALSRRRSVRIAGVQTLGLDITDADATWRVLAEARPTVVVHLAAVTSVGEAVADPSRAERVNVVATRTLVEQARRAQARFVYTSTDLVFDGTDPPYAESAQPNPLSVYGRTKLEAESAVLDDAQGVVARPSLMFGLPAIARPTTFARQLASLRDGATLRLFEDEFRTPLWLEDAARAIRAIGQSDFAGVVHLAGPERISRLAMGVAMARALGLPVDGIEAVSASSISFPEPRPADVSLDGGLLYRTFSDLPPARTVGEAVSETSPEAIAALPPTGGKDG